MGDPNDISPLGRIVDAYREATDRLSRERTAIPSIALSRPASTPAVKRSSYLGLSMAAAITLLSILAVSAFLQLDGGPTPRAATDRFAFELDGSALTITGIGRAFRVTKSSRADFRHYVAFDVHGAYKDPREDGLVLTFYRVEELPAR